MVEQGNECVCYIENGNLFWGDGTLVTDPALLICESDRFGCFLIRYGEHDELQKELIEKSVAFDLFGFGHLCIIGPVKEMMTLREQCYLIRRTVEYCASRFIGELSRLIDDPTGETLPWLRSEMRRVPIEI